MAGRQPQGLRGGHSDAGAIGPARPAPGERGPGDAGGALFRHGQPWKPDLESVDVTALVGAVCRLAMAERFELWCGQAGVETARIASSSFACHRIKACERFPFCPT